MTPDRQRDLCEACDGNGVIRLYQGTAQIGMSVCPACHGDCWATAAAPPPSAEGWQPIETAPKDGTTILVSGRGWGAFGSWHVDRWYTQVAWRGARPLVDGKRSVDPTHWMPLPAAQVTRPEEQE